MRKQNKKKKAIIYTPQKHHSMVRGALVFIAIVIFAFNYIVKVDVNAQDAKTAISTENLLDSHNEYRKSIGLGELTLNPKLNQSAQNKANAMLSSNCWSHYCPDGKSPWDFFNDAGYDYVYAGENLAEGFYNMEDVMNAWLNSPTHKANIEKKEYTEVGFGISYGDYLNNSDNVIIVVHFGTSRSNVVLTEDKKIEITNPKTGDTITGSSLDLQGNISGYDSANITDNNVLQGQAKIDNGIFTYKLENLSSGKHTIYADGIAQDGTATSSNIVEVTANSNVAGQFVQVNDTSTPLSVSSSTKNVVNLLFVAILAGIFLIDILVVARTKALQNFKSFSHYHLAILILVAFVIIVGGFAGQIHSGISI